MQTGPLGITRLLGVHYYVHDLERSRSFYLERLAFDEVGRSSPELEREGRQRSLVFQAGQIVVVCSTPAGPGGRAARYLSKHPDGVGSVMFEVKDIEHTFHRLESLGGTPITDIVEARDDVGSIRTFSITSPFGDTTFRFIENLGHRGILPGMEQYEPRGGSNVFGFTHIDHITTNFQTMKPALLWLEHVLGFEPMWEVSFHTRDVTKDQVATGSGLRSRVMWDPHSGVKFANNEPFRPSFKHSQINIFNEEHRGDGVQHLALAVRDVLSTVRSLRKNGVQFMQTPGSYYSQLPSRLTSLGIGSIEEDVALLRELEVLVDGHGHGSYLLQIFLKDFASLYGEKSAGPFFYEIIQRKGDNGFGEGNFRALFESIEREQSGAGGT